MPSGSKGPTSGASAYRVPRMLRSVRRCSWYGIVGSTARPRSRSPNGRGPHLAFTLALHHLLHFLFHRTARHARRALGLGSRFLPCRSLQLLSFNFISNRCRIHNVFQPLFSPAYFSTSFFNPYRGKLTVILASSPSPSRRTTVPVPYFGCSTVMPVRAALRGGAAAGVLAAAAGGAARSG